MSRSKPTPWHLLRGGTIRRVERIDRGRVVVEVHDAPFAPRVVRLALSGVVASVTHHLVSDSDDDLDTTDVAEVARRRPLVGDVTAQGNHVHLDDGHRGWTQLVYEELTGDETLRSSVRDALEAWCAQWSGDGLPDAIVALVRAPRWSRADLAPLLEAWRVDRTSDLAVALEVVDRQLRDDATAPEPHVTVDERVRWARDACAAGGGVLSSSEIRALHASVAGLRGELPDPRIGRGLVRMLDLATDGWLVVDPASEVITDDGPTFADELLQHVAHHADRGTPDLLDRAASTLRSCPAMATRLRALAAQLRALGPEDRTLPDEVEVALHVRAAV